MAPISAKIRSRSSLRGVFSAQGELQKCTIPQRTKEQGTLEITWIWYQTQENLVLGVNGGCSFIFGSSWHFVTKCDRCYIKCDSYFITRFKKCLLQNALGFFILKWDSLIINCDSYYYLRCCVAFKLHHYSLQESQSGTGKIRLF